MNVFKVFAASLKNIYSGEKVVVKHVLFLLFTSIVSCFSAYADNSLENNYMPHSGGTLLGILLSIIIGIYFIGYSLKFIHNSFNDCQINLLPEFNLEPFKIFWNVLPLIIVWGLYFIFLLLISLILSHISVILSSILWIGIAVLSLFVPYVYVTYAKDFVRKGLYNIKLPLLYFFKHSAGEYILLGLLILAFYLLIFTIFVGITLVMIILGTKYNSILYLLSSAGGYVGFIIQLVFGYCLVQIYKEKILDKV